MRRWLAFDIGCIECGEPSAVIGVFATQIEAQAACKSASIEQERRWRGQHSFEVFDLAGLPGTGVAEAPENAPSREDGAAPVPEPAHICADDDETNERPERPERAMPPWRASHQRT